MDDIFKFGKTGKLSMGSKLRNPPRAERAAILSPSSESSDSSDDEKRPAARRRRRKRKDETLASKLIHNKAVALDPSGGEDGVQSPEGGGWVHASMRTLFVCCLSLPSEIYKYGHVSCLFIFSQC